MAAIAALTLMITLPDRRAPSSAVASPDTAAYATRACDGTSPPSIMTCFQHRDSSVARNVPLRSNVCGAPTGVAAVVHLTAVVPRDQPHDNETLGAAGWCRHVTQ